MEKRFLVLIEDLKEEGIDLATLKKIKIEELYLSSKPSIKVTREGDRYFLIGVSAENPKKEIDKKEYSRLIKNSLAKVVKKTRYFIPDSNGVISDLDVYERDNLAVFKLKSDDSKMFRPYWLGREVTEDKRYEDDNISFFGNPQKGVAIKGPGSLVYQADIRTDDIYLSVDTQIITKGFWLAPAEEKIKLVYDEIFNYLMAKLRLLKFSAISNGPLTLDELLLLFESKLIFDEDKNEFFRHIVHYILKIISAIQGWEPVWQAEEDEQYLNQPFLDVYENNKFNKLITHMKTPTINTTRFILDFFVNHFCDEYVQMLNFKNSDSQ